MAVAPFFLLGVLFAAALLVAVLLFVFTRGRNRDPEAPVASSRSRPFLMVIWAVLVVASMSGLWVLAEALRQPPEPVRIERELTIECPGATEIFFGDMKVADGERANVKLTGDEPYCMLISGQDAGEVIEALIPEGARAIDVPTWDGSAVYEHRSRGGFFPQLESTYLVQRGDDSFDCFHLVAFEDQVTGEIAAIPIRIRQGTDRCGFKNNGTSMSSSASPKRYRYDRTLRFHFRKPRAVTQAGGTWWLQRFPEGVERLDPDR